MHRIIFFIMSVSFSSCSTIYYVVRHAEKEAGTTMTTTTIKTSDVPLSLQGQKRAEALKDSLVNEHVYLLWSTNTIRAKETIEPYRKTLGTRILLYSNDSLQHYITRWKKHKFSPLLIVGHSNTVDDIINGLVGENILHDLPDSQYGDLFIVKKTKRSF